MIDKKRDVKSISEEKAVNAVLKAEKEVRDGKILRGDLEQLAKQHA
jgi:hypothetical protein